MNFNEFLFILILYRTPDFRRSGIQILRKLRKNIVKSKCFGNYYNLQCTLTNHVRSMKYSVSVSELDTKNILINKENKINSCFLFINIRKNLIFQNSGLFAGRAKCRMKIDKCVARAVDIWL
ncbi:hypothetical protein PUN28_009422 [Cardiocondyla obscurior]|uniref:Uncharacterized protein n=1 Tax=Cardiocondyla obscurior TaxID=286306 RepID=A0AAW2FVI5_9HYME